MKYRVEVAVGDEESRVSLQGIVIVDADSPQDAKAEAETLVKESSVEVQRVSEVEGLGTWKMGHRSDEWPATFPTDDV